MRKRVDLPKMKPVASLKPRREPKPSASSRKQLQRRNRRARLNVANALAAAVAAAAVLRDSRSRPQRAELHVSSDASARFKKKKQQATTSGDARP